MARNHPVGSLAAIGGGESGFAHGHAAHRPGQLRKRAANLLIISSEESVEEAAVFWPGFDGHSSSDRDGCTRVGRGLLFGNIRARIRAGGRRRGTYDPDAVRTQRVWIILTFGNPRG